MRLLHGAARTHASFDDPNLVSCADLVPVMRLAQVCGWLGCWRGGCGSTPSVYRSATSLRVILCTSSPTNAENFLVAVVVEDNHFAFCAVPRSRNRPRTAVSIGDLMILESHGRLPFRSRLLTPSSLNRVKHVTAVARGGQATSLPLGGTLEIAQ
jgi:hypothetical protein